MNKILINGCSHMAGSECSTNTGSIFALNLDMDCENISNPGGGNHRILRSTIEYIEENGKPDFVLIGWTTQERFEFSWKGERANYTLDKHSDDTDLDKFYRYLDLNVCDFEIGKENTILYIFLLQQYLENNKIDYMFCNMFNSIPKGYQSNIWKLINLDKYYLHHTSLIEDALSEFSTGWSDTKHAIDPNIHKWMSSKLINFYRENYVRR